ncbi:TadE/TadG family type IV pilus assembly protein [Clostridium sp. Marseille-P2415]|uniref:TadE/TadG family type IV pilus assembly protein n=1 Tax=Clostridium sp. Marseille-P2415 TaxID=1805471 RepID=UPI001356406F|nr:TadE/TadG family type IV pilus assembly protein [Clostridium sp. Marseille-P2415]
MADLNGKDESGQSVLEFALILPVLVLLLTLPVDFFLYMNTQMTLSSAASECISRLDYSDISSGTVSNKVMQVISQNFTERLDPGMVNIKELNAGSSNKNDYSYYVYSSDLADPSDFGSQFEARPGSYQYTEVQLQLSYERSAVTFWGTLFLGNTYEVKTPVYSRNIYISGNTP